MEFSHDDIFADCFPIKASSPVPQVVAQTPLQESYSQLQDNFKVVGNTPVIFKKGVKGRKNIVEKKKYL